MLSRVAEAIYWMGRYLERAENTARFLEVNWNLSLDQPSTEQDLWSALVAVTGDQDFFTKHYHEATKEHVITFLSFDENYPNSIRSCLCAARENARTVREIIPVEMWEQMNTFHHWLADSMQEGTSVPENPSTFFEDIKRRCLTLGGHAESAMDHDEAGQFFQMGRFLERADKTSRILDVKYFLLLPDLNHVGTNLDYIQWTALLKATSSLQAYRHHFGRIVPIHVAKFLLLSNHFPRSVLYCLTQAQKSLHVITGTTIGNFTNLAEKRLGQLCAALAYHEIEDVFQAGLHEFGDDLQSRMNEIDEAIYTTFFANSPAHGGVGAEQ